MDQREGRIGLNLRALNASGNEHGHETTDGMAAEKVLAPVDFRGRLGRQD